LRPSANALAIDVELLRYLSGNKKLSGCHSSKEL